MEKKGQVQVKKKVVTVTTTPKKKIVKRSLMAKAVARNVLQKVRKGAKISIGEEMRKVGYSETTSQHPSKVTEQIAYREEIDPFLQKLITERDAIIEAMPAKRKGANYMVLSIALQGIVKNVELLSGKPTERHDGLSDEDRLALDTILRKNKR